LVAKEAELVKANKRIKGLEKALANRNNFGLAGQAILPT
jgi:hypothetical protein